MNDNNPFGKLEARSAADQDPATQAAFKFTEEVQQFVVQKMSDYEKDLQPTDAIAGLACLIGAMCVIVARQLAQPTKRNQLATAWALADLVSENVVRTMKQGLGK